MIAELYAQITTALGSSIAEVYDLKLPDEYGGFSQPIIVALPISDTPEQDIQGEITVREQRMTLEVQALDLTLARTVAEALIAALQGWRGGPVTACWYVSSGPDLYASELVPPRYCLPLDFMIQV